MVTTIFYHTEGLLYIHTYGVENFMVKQSKMMKKEQ